MKLKFTDEELEVLGNEFVDLVKARAIVPSITFEAFLEGEMWLKSVYANMAIKEPRRGRLKSCL